MKHSLHTFFQKTGTDKKMLFKFALLLVVALLLGLFALFYGRDITAWLRHPEQVRDTLLGLDVWGVAGYVGLEILSIVTVIVPGDLVCTCGGYLYGLPLGFLLTWSSSMLGAAIAFYLSRLLGYDFISRLLSKKAVMQCTRVLNSAKGMLGVMVAFLVPVFPKDVLVYVAGLTPISATRLFFVYALARIPNTLVWTMVGSTLYERNYPALLATLAVLLTLLVGGYLTGRKMGLGKPTRETSDPE